jgi:enoyl-CoA hydratase/carnithine racemase
MANSVMLDRRDSVAIVILNRPEVLNAVNVAMRETLITLLAELNKDDAVRAIVITGTGDRAFCSGQDLDETSKYGVGDVDAWLTRQHAMYAAVRDLDKPCIIAFNGTAAGAGFQIGLCADLRAGYPEMKMGQPEIKAGLASIVGSYLMTMHLGLSKNIELSLTGELISGRTAYEIGILNHLVPQKEVLEKSLALAADMAKLAPTAMRLTKQRFRKLTQPGFEAALEEAKVAQKEAYASGEPQQAMRKFLEARKSRKA